MPVLSEPSAGLGGAAADSCIEAVLAQVADLARHEVYASGPPAMIEAVRREFAARGVDPRACWFDSFDYAPDTLDRHRTTADTKS